MTPPSNDRPTQGSGGGQGRGAGSGQGRGKPGGRKRQGGGKQGGGPQGGRKQGGKQQGGKQRAGRSAPEDRVAELARPLRKVLERIPATQREVLEWRMGLKDGHPHDLSSTAQQLGLSVQETREIEQRAFEHIREVVPLEQLQKFLGS